MATHRALVLQSRDSPLELKTVPSPSPSTGSVIVRVEALYILPYVSGQIPLISKRGLSEVAPEWLLKSENIVHNGIL